MIFLAVDVVFIFLYAIFGILKVLGLAPEIPSLQLNADTGLASVWNYGKLMISIGALSLIWLRLRSGTLLILLGLFMFLLLDDYYELHDMLARALGERISFEPLDGLHPQNRGELFVYSAILAIAAPLLWLAVRDVQPASRTFVGALAVGILMIGMFGVAVDVLHGVIDALLGGVSDLVSKIFNRLMTIIEDGGEMVAMTFSAWLCLVGLSERRIA